MCIGISVWYLKLGRVNMIHCVWFVVTLFYLVYFYACTASEFKPTTHIWWYFRLFALNICKSCKAAKNSPKPKTFKPVSQMLTDSKTVWAPWNTSSSTEIHKLKIQLYCNVNNIFYDVNQLQRLQTLNEVPVCALPCFTASTFRQKIYGDLCCTRTFPHSVWICSCPVDQ